MWSAQVTPRPVICLILRIWARHGEPGTRTGINQLSPDGMQRLLRRADWDVDGVRNSCGLSFFGRDKQLWIAGSYFSYLAAVMLGHPTW
jgi:hypothetical protein